MKERILHHLRIGVRENWYNTATMTTCDLLVKARWLLPIAPQNTAFDHHAIAIKNGRIIALGKTAKLSADFNPSQSLDLEDHIVLPGLVNSHGHAAMSLLRGAGEDQSLQVWLSDSIWPLETRIVNADMVSLGTEVAIAEMLASGTTTFSDMYFFPEQAAAVADRLGMRAQICFPVIEASNVWSDGVIDGLHKGLALHDAFRHHERIRIAFGPHAAYTVSIANLEKVAMYANEIDAQVQIHLHENAAEVEEAIATRGRTWIEELKDIGLLGPNLQAVHMTEVSDEDLDTIAASRTRIVHCPTSNLKLASGYAPVARYREANIHVGLGTDGAASNNCLNLFSEAHIASLLAKHEANDPTQGTAPDTIRMATLESAIALGMEDNIGSLEVGKAADFIAVDARTLSMLPAYDPFAALVHGDAGNSVSHVYVEGQALCIDGELTRCDVSGLSRKVTQWHAKAL